MPTALDITFEEVVDLAHESGLDMLRVTSVEPFENTERIYKDRLAMGFLGEMAWITPQRIHQGCTPRELLPNARSIVMGACSYLTPDKLGPDGDMPRGKVARYALGDDYHDTIKLKLRKLHSLLEERLGRPVGARISVDSGPVVDRAVAARSGLGWYGKNTNILTSELGSWVLLGAMILDVELPESKPVRKSCGACTLCLTACPTGALVAPGVLDSRKCISYLTIELRGPIPREMRPQIANWIFGCDICQEVCPVNRKAPETTSQEFAPRDGWGREPDLVELMTLTDEQFSQRFKGSPVKRAKRRGLLRNVAVALGNSGDRRAVPALVGGLHDHEPLVRGHSAWALGRVGGIEAREALQEALILEADEWVREEIVAGLGEISASD